jgi:DNA-binding response OmpR family regulator
MESKPTILIVDDDVEIRRLLQEFLESNGFSVLLAEDGQQALKRVAEQVPDLVITDLLLPKEHGIDVMQTIKDKFFLPIIAISGIYKESEVRNRVNDIYIEGFFEKPLDLNGILACIRSTLNE